MSDKLIHINAHAEHGNKSPDMASMSDHQPETLVDGTIRAIGSDGRIFVGWGDSESESCAARTLVDIFRKDVGRAVLLAFPTGETRRPVILGMVKDRCQPNPGQQIDLERSDVQNYTIDGETVHFSAKKEILLECGKGSIRLRKDGKIIIKGVQVVSRAKGMNKVKGAAVSIN